MAIAKAVSFAVEQGCGALGMQKLASETIKPSTTGWSDCRLGNGQHIGNQCTVRNAQSELNYRLEIRTAGGAVRQTNSGEQPELPGVIRWSLGVGKQAGMLGLRSTPETEASQATLFLTRIASVSRQSHACGSVPVKNSPDANRQLYVRNVAQERCSRRPQSKSLMRRKRMAEDIRQEMQ